MRGLSSVFYSGLFVIGANMAIADDLFRETFENAPETRWDYVADTVMGGVSTGELAFLSEDGKSFARLTGRVSTDNNGGFIQFRHKLTDGPGAEVTGVRLWVRGNGERYFVHLRTRGTLLPWQYYQAEFPTNEDWTEVRLPLTAFKPSGAMLRATPSAGGITSVGVVAYGRDHAARVDVSEVGFY